MSSIPSPKQKKNNIKKNITTLISLLGVGAAVAMIIGNIRKNKKKSFDYDKQNFDADIVLQSLDEVLKEKGKKDKTISKGIALRIIKLQLDKIKLENRDSLSEDNVCEMNKKLKAHIESSCKYSKDPYECAERVFGIDMKSLKDALSIFKC